MKKITKYLVIIFIFIFSIYYTDKSMDILKLKDPIMEKVKDNLDKYKVEPVNAFIDDNIISLGKKGQEVDIEKTYNEMRKYGSYNEGLTKIKEVTPTISITNNLDKYIKINKNENKEVVLLFIINDKTNLNNLINILNKNDISSTIYIEENHIEENIEILKDSKYEIELLNPNKQLFTSTKSYIESLTNQKLKFCYTEEENKDLIKLCKKNKMYTIMPSLIIKEELYKNVKSNIETSPIISIYLNKYLEKDLSTTINYLKSKGYKFYDLNSFINED